MSCKALYPGNSRFTLLRISFFLLTNLFSCHFTPPQRNLRVLQLWRQESLTLYSPHVSFLGFHAYKYVWRFHTFITSGGYLKSPKAIWVRAESPNQIPACYTPSPYCLLFLDSLNFREIII